MVFTEVTGERVVSRLIFKIVFYAITQTVKTEKCSVVEITMEYRCFDPPRSFHAQQRMRLQDK